MALLQVKVKNFVEGVTDHPQSGWLGFFKGTAGP
jgi:hypothetical protein